MKHQLFVEYTRFENLNSQGDVISTSFGYRMHNHYAKYYISDWSSFKELRSELNEDNLLEVILETPGFEDIELQLITAIIFNGKEWKYNHNLGKWQTT
jgi:hypothetical protein